jgi:pimeloyl-ACP methyl ester carboxylesterase
MTMSKFNKQSLSDIRGAARLAIDATVNITDIVDQMHHTIELGHLPIGPSRASTTQGLTGLIYKSIKGSTRLIGKGIDTGMSSVAGLLPEEQESTVRNTIISILNGAYGDHLSHSSNPLALTMSLRSDGRLINPEQPHQELAVEQGQPVTDKVMIFAHGLCMSDQDWENSEGNLGKRMAKELGYTPLYLRYNTGLPISTNGENFANLLEDLVQNWPTPISNLTLVGHSMGGLVSRSASHHAHQNDHTWPEKLGQLVFIGSPHNGSPLERGGNLIDYIMGLSPYIAPFARLVKARSAGIKDLRHGNITTENKQFIQLPTNVDCYAFAAILGTEITVISECLSGDGLVPLDSAFCIHKDTSRTLNIPEQNRWIGCELGHNEMLCHPEIFKQLHTWLK